MDVFISGDWGTSKLRLRLMRSAPLEVLAEVESDRGVAATFAAWRQAGSPADREGFFLEVLAKALGDLERNLPAGLALGGSVLVLSGMGSSSLGLRELPYADTPFRLTGEAATLARIPIEARSIEVWLISGVRAADDVMRGEETILMGLAAAGRGDGLYLLPGTHSKHVVVRDGAAAGFRTYLTGEIYDLLSNHSVLQTCLIPAGGPDADFEQGVVDGAATECNLLHEFFALRAGHVLGSRTRIENGSRLSGLLIGSELRDLIGKSAAIIVAASEPLLSSYLAALRVLGLGEQARVVSPEDLALAVARGQLAVLGVARSKSS